MKYYAIKVSICSDDYDNEEFSDELFASKKIATDLLEYLRKVYCRFDGCWNLEGSIQAFFKGIPIEDLAHKIALEDYGCDEDYWEERFKDVQDLSLFDECWIGLVTFDKIITNSTTMETE